MDGVMFKIDFEKAYDKVKCSFLQQTLRMNGFDKKMVRPYNKFCPGWVSWNTRQ